MMLIVTSIMGRGCVGKYAVVTNVIVYHPADVECRGIESVENMRRTDTQVAQDRNDRDA